MSAIIHDLSVAGSFKLASAAVVTTAVTIWARRRQRQRCRTYGLLDVSGMDDCCSSSYHCVVPVAYHACIGYVLDVAGGVLGQYLSVCDLWCARAADRTFSKLFETSCMLVKRDKRARHDKDTVVRETFRLLDDPSGLKMMFENVVTEPLLLDARDCAGRSLLMKAAQKGSLRLTEALLAARADPNLRGGNGWTPLHYASIGRRTEVCDLLIKWKADVTCKSTDGYDPLFYAHRCGDDKVVNCLLSHGARPDSGQSKRSGVADVTCLKYAVSIGEDGSVEAGGILQIRTER